MVPPSKTTRTVQELMAQVSMRWQAGDLTRLENALHDLCDEAKRSGEVSPGLNRGLPSLGLASWRTLLEIAEAASMTPGSVAADHVLALMHAFSAGAAVGSPAAASKEVGGAVDMLCAYIDSILVPLVLRQPALRSDAAQCPCERCLGAAQAVRGLTASQDLRELTEAIAFPFLFSVLEMAAKAQLEGEVEEGSGHPRVAQAAEALAVLGTYARLQEERWHFEVPPNVVHAIVFLLRTGRRHGGAPSPPRPLMLQVLHVVRNVSANHAEVMQLTAEAFSESGNQLWAALEAWPAQEAAPKAPKEHRAEGPRRRRREAAAPDAATDVERKLEQQPLVAEAVAAAFGGGNPQESDEQESSAEVGPHPGARKDKAEAEALQTPGAQADGSIGTASGSEDTATSAPPVPAARARCAELLSLYSLVLQALFQTDEALQQRLFVSEEAIRLQMVIVARALRTSELLPKWQERLAFQGIRMYLLVCRSSHIRKQYVVLQSAFIEEERRAVAYLLSLTPAAQRCCVLLRAMAQDVHSWLLWQSQASARAEPVPRPPAAPRLRDKDGQPKARESTRRRRETGDSSEGAADSPAAARSAAKGRRSSEASGKSQPPPPPPGPRPPALKRRSSKAVKAARAAAPAVAFEDLCDTMRFAAADDGGSGDAPYVVTEPEPPAPERMFDEEALSLVNLFNGGEAVWLIHSLMVLLIALVLVAWWYSLETPNQPMSIEAMYQFWRKNS